MGIVGVLHARIDVVYTLPYTVTLDQRRKNDQRLPHGTMESEQHDGATGVFEHEWTWTNRQSACMEHEYIIYMDVRTYAWVCII